MRKAQLRSLPSLSFVWADLGCDVIGCGNGKKLKTWKKPRSAKYSTKWNEDERDLQFSMERAGGVQKNEKFDIVSIQMAIHYMMDTRQRARR